MESGPSDGLNGKENGQSSLQSPLAGGQKKLEVHRTLFAELDIITGSLNFTMGGIRIGGRFKAEAIYDHVSILQMRAYDFKVFLHPILS